MSTYPDHYHREVDRRMGARGTDVLTEILCERSALEAFLAEYPGAVVFVTHDRAFLERLATRIVELDRGRLTSWAGDYTSFLARKHEWLAAEGLQRRGTVGHGEARLVRSRDVVRVAVGQLRENETVFLDPPGVCKECDEARASLP